MKNTLHTVSIFKKVGLFGLLAISASFAQAQSFTIQNNQLTIEGGSGTSFVSQSPTISSSGVVATVSNVPTTSGLGLVSFKFNLEPNSLPNGTYVYRVAVVFDDVSSDRRLEAKIENLTLEVTGTAPNQVVKGTIPDTDSLRLFGRNRANTLQVDITVPNNTASGPITISGSQVAFDAANLISRIRTSNSAFNDVILAEFDQPSTYTYRIAVQQKPTETISFGTKSNSTVTNLPKFGTQGGPTAANEFILGGTNNFSSSFSSAYTVTGQFNVATVSSNTGGSTTTVTSSTSTQTTTNASVTTALNNLGQGAPVTTAIATQVDTAVSSAAQLATNTIAAIATLTSTQALDAFTTISTSIVNAGTAASATASAGGAAINKGSAVTAMINLASAFLSLNTSKSLDDNEKATVNTIATTTLTGATNLVTTGTSTADILSIVSASSSILAQATAVNGTVVASAVVDQVKELTKKAVAGVIANLNLGTTPTTEQGVRDLMRANPSVLEVALTASASLPNNAKITIGGVQFTREQLIAQSLAGGGTTTPLQGGFNFSAATASFTVTTDSSTGNMTLSNGTEKYVAASPSSRLVPVTVPDGISYLPNGTAVLVGNGVATELSPTAFDSAGFTSVVSSAGYVLTYKSNGTISIALANNERFSGAFAYDNLGAAASCGAITITSPTGSPASPNYAFTLKCANGPTQRITPIADNAKFYTVVAGAKLNASTNRNTGVVTIPTVGSFKPSFFVTPLSINDTAYYNATKNSDGIAFRAKDVNGDGKVDYEIISENGLQVMYGQ